MALQRGVGLGFPHCEAHATAELRFCEGQEGPDYKPVNLLISTLEVGNSVWSRPPAGPFRRLVEAVADIPAVVGARDKPRTTTEGKHPGLLNLCGTSLTSATK